MVSSATVAIDETDKAVTTSGTLISTDVDNPDNAFTPDSIIGANGNLNIDANGHWTFTANSAFNQLNVGDKVEETFTVSSIDGTPSTIKVTINGTNDKATVSTATVSVDETDKAVTTSGTLTSTDVDNPDNTFTPDSITGANGDLTIDANGHWAFTANSAFNQLNVGDKVEETFTVSSIDGTPSTIKVTINGTNDKATVSSATVTIDETDKAVTTSGTLTSTDVDNPDNTFTPDSISGTNGNLNIDTHGQWTFTANNVFNQLNVGDKVEETFTVSSVDGTTSTIKVTINGTNDKATVSSATVAIDETDKAVTTSGTLTSTDVDNPDNTFTPDSISGTNGNLTIDVNGHWVFTANSAFNQLNVGDKVEETFTVSSVDGTTSTIKVAINGTNDKATVSSATVAIDETDKAVTTSGTLTSTDIDNPDNTFTPDSISGTNGNLNIDANGHWVFTANSAFNQLNVGDKVEETFTVSSVDGTPSTIKMTINGTNDVATVSSATVAIDETDKAATTSGTLTSTDVDNPDNTFTPDSITGTNGNLNIDAHGQWTFIANSAFNQLNVGDKVEETFTVSSVDGTPSTIKITIKGTNDKATVSSANVAVDETDTAVTTSGTLTSTDVDNPDNTFTPDSISGTNGNLTIDVNGHWVFTANSAFNQLNVGDKVEETFTVASVDGTTSTIKVTINGTNDAATVSTATVALDETDTAISTSGTLTSTDVDNPDNAFTPDSISGTHGDLTIDANGHWTFTANSAFNQLNVGDKVEETFTVASVDGTTSTIKVTINGTNDKALIAGGDTASLEEFGSHASALADMTNQSPDYHQAHNGNLFNQVLSATGHLTVIDPDSGEAEFQGNTNINGQYGHLSLFTNGNWVYEVSAGNSVAGRAIDKLGEGEELTDTITIHSKDGTPHDIVITIHGDNDRPYCSSEVQLNSGTEDTRQTITVADLLKNTVDVDNNDATLLTIENLHANHGSIAINKDGSFSFTPEKDYNGDVHFTYDVKDGHGGVTHTGATTSLVAVADSAKIGGTDTASLEEFGDRTSALADMTDHSPDYHQEHQSKLFNQILSAKGHLTITDPDIGEAEFQWKPTINGQYGHLSIWDNGNWVYEVSAGNSAAGRAIDKLGQGEELTDTMTVHSKDGTPHDIVITIHGDNDRPYCSSEVILNAGTEDTRQNITVADLLQNTVDVDQNDAGLLTIENLHANHGSIAINKDGSFSFTPEKDYNGDVHFTYDVKDAHGGVTHTGATTNLAAVGDAAIITGDDKGDVSEHQNPNMSPDYAQPGMGTLWNNTLHESGQLSITDADAGEASFVTHGSGYGYHGQLGKLHLKENGVWSYVVDNNAQSSSGRTIDALGAGETITDTITVESKDGTTHDIVITIHGDNDRPYCSSEVQLNSGTEDTRQTITIAQLLQNTVDVDNNDAGILTIENLHTDHGSIATNPNGSFSYTPEKDYNGQVHFTYDVKDGHGGITHTGATTTLTAVNDNPDATPITDSVTEDTDSHHSVNLLGTATDIDGDPLTISHIQATFEGHTGPLPVGVGIASDGHTLIIDSHSSAFQHLSAGQKSDITVHYMIDDNHGGQTPAVSTITVVGADDKANLVSNIIQLTETQALDSQYHTYKGALQLVDPDTGSNTQFVFSGTYLGQGYAPGTLDVFPDGSYQFRLQGALNRHADDLVASLHSGESKDFPYEIKTSDGQTLTVMVKVTGEDSNAQIHVSMPNSLPANQSVTEEHFVPASATNLYAGGRLRVVDPDHDQSYLQAETINTAHHGQFKISADGGWSYTIDNSIDPVQKLGAGESFTETHTVHSLDGTASQLLTVTVQGTNDAPVVSAAVKLAPGIEDTDIQLNKSDLLSNATDIDHNDIGHLNITNLVADHGVIVDNKDGTFNFHPEPNYNGQVHFSYDVIDGHGGVTHTGASTTLAAVNDAAVFSVDDTGSVKEDVHVQGDSQHTVAVSGVLIVSDPDAGESEFVANRNVHAVSDQFGGDLSIGRAGDWTYSVPNNNLNRLAEGEKHQVTYEVVSRGGDKHQIVITVVGTNDDPILSVTQTTPTTGTLTETDVDVKDMHTFSVVSSTGQFGSLSVDPDTGAYVYTANSAVAGMTYNSATHTYHGTDVFEVKVADNHGGESSKFITFDTNGHVFVVPGQQPTISTTVPVNPLITTTQPSLPTGTNTPPSNAVTLDLAASSDTGISDTDNVTKETTPTITGHTDIPYSQVTVYDGSTLVGHAVSDASGQYSVAVSSLSDGDHNLSAKALAPSSVLPATSSLLSVHIDTQVHVGIQTDPITSDNVVNAQESNSSIDITGSVSGDFNAGDIVTLNVNGTQHTGVVDAKGHYSIAVSGSELITDADQKIEASIAVTDGAGNSAHVTTDVTYQVDTQVSVPTITFENAGADNLYSKAEIARGLANTITATVTPPGDAKIGEHLAVNGQDHVLDAHSLQHGIQIEVHPGSNVQATMTDEHGNTAGSQGFAASAIPEPIIVRPPSGSHQVSGTLGVPPLLPSLTPVPTAQSGWRIHLPNGQYVTSHHGQYGTLTIDPQTGHLHYQEQAQIHTGPHGSASGIGQHEDRFEVALQGTNQDEVVAHVNIQILSHGPGHSGKLTVGTEVVDMTITPVVHTSHPAPPPPPPVQHDEPDMASQADFTVTLSDDSNLNLTHQEPDEKTSHHGAAAYLDALGIKPDATSTTVHDQPADMDIVLAQVDQPDAATHDQAHLDMSDALEHHDVNINHNQDDEHHHHNDVDGLPDIDPNS
ncbi:VCBS domain-containing protein [Vibrio splendidus]|nr:VCBS domain-containing protein [Vibrio splendidus]PMK14891.1 hypothetical protein BCU10_15180 [Vibrio splendidus]